ncbi:MAG TPA: tetratricopeptide repeat protein [Gemmataceae bacterium]|nr:tetratricopeptide repeat protein [Gemmataceae bacterium]
MSANDAKHAPAAPPSTARAVGNRGRAVAVIVCVGLLILLLGGLTGRMSRSAPRPPEVNLAGLDPEIVAAVQNAQADVENSPHSAAAWGKLGTILVVHEFRREGIYCLQQAEQLDPRDPRWPYLQALDGLLANDMETSLPKLEKAVSLCGNEPDAPRLRLAEIYLSQNRLDDAEKQFRLLLQTNPRHPRAQFGLARISFQRGDALASLEQLSVPQHDILTRKGACILLAQVEQQLGHTAAAEQAKQRAANLPEDPFLPDPYNEEAIEMRTGKDAWIKKARRLSEIGKEDEARELLRKTVKTYPDADDGWRQLGKTLLKQRDPVYAEKALRRACELAPDMFENVYFLGSALVAQKRLPEATALFRRTTELKPDYANAWHDLGNASYEAKDRRGAAAAYRNAIRFDPNRFDNHVNLAVVLAEQGGYAEALLHLLNALRLKPTDPFAQRMISNLVATLALGCSAY